MPDNLPLKVIDRGGTAVNEVIVPDGDVDDSVGHQPAKPNADEPVAGNEPGAGQAGAPAKTEPTPADQKDHAEPDAKPKDEPEPPAPPAETPAPEPPSIDSIIKEKTNGKFTSIDAVIAELNKPAAPAEPKFKDDYIKKAVEYYESTGTLQPYLEAFSRDYTKIDDEGIFKLELREKYPNISEKAFNKIYQKEVIERFNLDEENNDPEDVEIGRELMSVEAKQKREAYIKRQQEFQVPPKTDDSVDQAAAQEAANQQFEKWVQEVKAAPATVDLANNKRVVVAQDGQTFNYEVNDPNAIVEMATNQDKFWSLFLSPDGKVDFGKFYKIAAYAAGIDTFEKSLINHGKSLGKAEVLGKIKNPVEPNDGLPPGNDAEDPNDKNGLLNAFLTRGVSK